MKSSPPQDKDAFYKVWLVKRSAALTNAAWTDLRVFALSHVRVRGIRRD